MTEWLPWVALAHLAAIVISFVVVGWLLLVMKLVIMMFDFLERE